MPTPDPHRPHDRTVVVFTTSVAAAAITRQTTQPLEPDTLILAARFWSTAGFANAHQARVRLALLDIAAPAAADFVSPAVFFPSQQGGDPVPWYPAGPAGDAPWIDLRTLLPHPRVRLAIEFDASASTVGIRFHAQLLLDTIRPELNRGRR